MNRNDYENILAERYEDGFSEGVQDGMQKGREEALLQTAQKMKNMGLSTEMIIQITGLSEEECNAL